MFTFDQCINSTPSNIKWHAKWTGVRLVQAAWRKDSLGTYKEYETSVMGYSDERRRVLVRAYGNHPNLLDDEVWVHCDCPWFLYNCEVALALNGSSSVINSNGDLPIVRNPRLQPWVCKHVIGSFKKIKNAYVQKKPYAHELNSNVLRAPHTPHPPVANRPINRPPSDLLPSQMEHLPGVQLAALLAALRKDDKKHRY